MRRDLTHSENPAEDSLKKRYLYKLITNIVIFLLSFITISITTRALGPSNYGNFGFLTIFFTQVVNFVEFGTTSCFYSKLSQRPAESGLLRFYWWISALVGIGVLLLVHVALSMGLAPILWPGQEMLFIWMAALWGLLTWTVTQMIRSIIDAYGLTVGGEVAQMQQRFVATVVLVLLFWVGWLNLTTYFLQQYLMLILIAVGWGILLHRRGYHLFPTPPLPISQVKHYTHELYRYSGPLVVMGFVILVTEIADRWLLQTFAGSIQQGFFTLSSRIGAVCFVFTSAMTPLLFREFARASGNNDLGQMRHLFQRYIPMLYAIAAFFAVFVAVQARAVSLIFGGSDYAAASLAVGIMAFYPIHQTYGQLSGSLFLARGETRLYRNISIGASLAGIPVIFWLLAPSSLFGLELGAMGVAIKMVVIQFIAVNVQLWYNIQLLHLSFWKFLWHQMYVVALFFGLALAISTLINPVFQHPLPGFLLSGALYTLSCIGLAFAVPSVFSATHEDWKALFGWVHARILRR
jgi:O-antigen/teichoic acid export membrane protein